MAISLVVLQTARTVSACESSAPWSRLQESARNYASPLPILLTSGAIAAPILLAPTGADHELRLLAQRQLGGRPNLEPVSIWTPFVVPVALALVDAVALGAQACAVARPSSAMLQSMALTIVTVTGLKWATGRSWPNAGRDPMASDRLQHPEFAHSFDWFSWSRGNAWPSGHTASMVAAATTLTTITRGRSWLGYAAIVAATGVAAGMWLGDHHWGSDIFSGGLFGAAFGHSVGLAFRDDSTATKPLAYAIAPWKAADVDGIRLVMVW